MITNRREILFVVAMLLLASGFAHAQPDAAAQRSVWSVGIDGGFVALKQTTNVSIFLPLCNCGGSGMDYYASTALVGATMEWQPTALFGVVVHASYWKSNGTFGSPSTLLHLQDQNGNAHDYEMLWSSVTSLSGLYVDLLPRIKIFGFSFMIGPTALLRFSSRLMNDEKITSGFDSSVVKFGNNSADTVSTPSEPFPGSNFFTPFLTAGVEYEIQLPYNITVNPALLAMSQLRSMSSVYDWRQFAWRLSVGVYREF